MPDLIKAAEVLPCPFCGGPSYLNRSCKELSDDLDEGWVECDYCLATSGTAHSSADLEKELSTWNKFSTIRSKEEKKKQRQLSQSETDQLLLELECQ